VDLAQYSLFVLKVPLNTNQPTINHLIAYCDCVSDLYLYANDAKLFKHIKNEFTDTERRLD